MHRCNTPDLCYHARAQQTCSSISLDRENEKPGHKSSQDEDNAGYYNVEGKSVDMGYVSTVYTIVVYGITYRQYVYYRIAHVRDDVFNRVRHHFCKVWPND